MSLRQIEPSREEREQLEARFMIAADAPVVTPEVRAQQIAMQNHIRAQIAVAAFAVQNGTEPSREQFCALTHLEEALLWAGKAIFS